MNSSLFTALFILLLQSYHINGEKSNELIIKFIFADKIISFNSNDRIYQGNSSNTVSTTLPPNMLPDTFICYIIVKYNLEIKLSGNFTHEFKLHYESSTSVVTGHNKRRSVYKMYSLKLARQLTDRYKHHELDFNLSDLNNKTEFLCSLFVSIDTPREYENHKR